MDRGFFEDLRAASFEGCGWGGDDSEDVNIFVLMQSFEDFGGVMLEGAEEYNRNFGHEDIIACVQLFEVWVKCGKMRETYLLLD